MTPHPLLLAGLVALALNACSRTESEAVPAPEVAVEPAMEVEPAVAPVADPAVAAPTFSITALAGRFEGDGSLLLNADGSYNHTIAGTTGEGTWGQEVGDPTRVRLDPNSKSVEDRVLQIVSNDELKPVAADGAMTPASDGSFRRVATP